MESHKIRRCKMKNPITGIFRAKKKYQSKYYADYKERLRKRKAIDEKIAKDKQLAIKAIDEDVNRRLNGSAGLNLVTRMLHRCSRWGLGAYFK